ncbi:uncharacterized protein LOC117338063 [Pecten maximus]|uniref:uncharacterized protein LOC117338063 n=1 Tax=Pecten maximus TaxID=6579 RepID=UPI001458BE4B|nr:uncharacterized protein LOC117338063 [Pecten maximus]
MDLMWKEEFECGDTQMNGFLHSITSVTSKVNKPPTYNFIDDVLSSYLPCDDDGFELFVGCEDGLFNVCLPVENEIESDIVQWKCIAKPEDALNQELLQRVQEEDCLTALGVGKVPEKMPELIQKQIYNKMRPTLSSSGTQVKTQVSESHSQTDWRGLRTQTVASLAKPGTADCGVQAKPMTYESGTCTSPMDSGVQVTPTDHSDCCTSRSSQRQQHVTVQVVLSPSRLNGQEDNPISIKINGVTRKLNKRDSNLFLDIVRCVLKSNTNLTSASLNQAIKMELKDIPFEMFDFPPNCGSGDLQHVQPNVIDTERKRHDFLQQSVQSNAQKMTTGEGGVRYHAELPFYKHNEKYLSATSPFSKFGYNIIGDIPQTLRDIRIPVVSPKDVVLKKDKNGSEVLGSGSFGCVYLAKHEQYPFDVCVKEFEMDSSTIYDIHHEAKLLIYLQTTKFVPLCLGLMESPFISSDLSLVQECFAHGCTLRMLLKNKPLVSSKRKWIAVCYQLFWGLNMIHEKQVLLNDIKSDNILVDYNSSDIMSNIRFIDLGLASYRRGYRFCNGPAYLEQFENYAPEIRHGYHSTPASDLYAVGYLVDKISETFLIPEVDPIARECTVEDPKKRPSCYSVLDKLEDIIEIM